ncbi:MAG: dihydroorotate dehydrogenase electron transfer subunit [Clostridia bacterium]|nr:dihydroorotate dehydrogenase electron transfer subunit [Clostridia bacterium]
MKQTVFEIKENIKIADSVYRMTLCGDTEGIRCGQFVNIKLDGLYLRRPISVCDVEEDGTLVLIYKVVGKGTERMSGMTGGRLDILTQLGNGYDISRSGGKPLLIGGGVGVPPLYMLAKKLISDGKNVTVILGFNTKTEIFYENEFRAIGASVYVATADGSYGTRGFVTDVLSELGSDFTYFYTCGPEPMLRAVANATAFDGEMSFEERMGCGFGACMGCSCKTLAGNKRICKDGPVMRKEEIIWNV